jgi:hypothetical protein
METLSDTDLKREARNKALQTAEHMQPLNNMSYNGRGLQDPKRDISQLLKDAETIYNWLIKDL